MIPHNLNLKETVARLMLAFVLIITGWLLGTFWLFPIGMVLTVSGLAGYCPVYQVLGIHRAQEN